MRVQQQVCVLKGCEEGEEVQTARQILKEARDSRAVSPCSYSVCGSEHVIFQGGCILYNHPPRCPTFLADSWI